MLELHIACGSVSTAVVTGGSGEENGAGTYILVFCAWEHGVRGCGQFGDCTWQVKGQGQSFHLSIFSGREIGEAT